MVMSNVGFFYHGFSEAACQKYYMLAPICKVFQIMVSQSILGARTYKISRRSPQVYWFLAIFGTIIMILDWFTNLYARVPSQTLSNCGAVDGHGRLTTWSFYLIAMIYDLTTLGLSTYYLLKSAPDRTKMSDLIQMMLLDGLGYWILLTAINILNLILYRMSNKALQTAGASFGYTVVWIMSQNLLIHMRDAVAQRSRQKYMVTQELSTAKDVVDAMRSQFAVPDEGDSGRSVSDQELDVQIQIERAVTVEYIPYGYQRDRYRTPKVQRGKPAM